MSGWKMKGWRGEEDRGIEDRISFAYSTGVFLRMGNRSFCFPCAFVFPLCILWHVQMVVMIILPGTYHTCSYGSWPQTSRDECLLWTHVGKRRDGRRRVWKRAVRSFLHFSPKLCFCFPSSNDYFESHVRPSYLVSLHLFTIAIFTPLIFPSEGSWWM